MLLQDIKNTIKHSAIYGVSRISTKLISFILLPLYSLNFTVSEYGIFILIESLWQILWSIFLFGIENAVIRWYTIIEDNNKKKQFLFTVTLFLFVINLIFTLIFFYSSSFLSQILLGSTDFSVLILYASLIASIEAILFLVFLLIRINERVYMYVTFSILMSVINLIIQIYYLLYTTTKLEGIFIAKIISPSLIFIILLPYYVKFLKIGIEFKLLNEVIVYSFPIMVSSMLSTLLNQLDRYILELLSSTKEVGYYGLGYNICGLINVLIIGPFALAFSVIAWKKISDANAKRFFTKSITYLSFTVFFAAIFISLFTPHFIKILTLKTDYWVAKNIVPWIALSTPFYGMPIIGFFSFYISKMNKYLIYFYALSLFVNIIINIILIPQLGMYGAAIANFTAFLILNIVTYYYSKKGYYFDYEWTKIITLLFCSIIIIAPFFIVNIESTFTQIILKLFALIIFPFILYIFKFYEPVEIERIKGFLIKYFKNQK